jgi:HSP20 family molecular chaperone IbpA
LGAIGAHREGRICCKFAAILESLTLASHIDLDRRANIRRTVGMPKSGPVKVASGEGFEMSRVPSLSSPFLIGFDEIERALDRISKAADGYPPYNIERLAKDEKNPERMRITLAVAGFTLDQLEVTVDENELVICGRQQEDKGRQYLHRGIAARQFQRTFVLADGMEVLGADLRNGLLSVDLARPDAARAARTVNITEHE